MPDMKEKLVELLTDCEAKGFWSYGTDSKTGEHGGHEMTAEDIADYLAENIASKWISVKDGLPKGGAIVLCNTDYFVEVLQWDERADMWVDQYRSYRKNYVTHWMPLPQPPKGE